MKNKYNWNFKEFCESDLDFEKQLNIVKKQLDEFTNEINNLDIFSLLEKYYDISFKIEKLLVYAELNSDLDMANQKYLQYKSLINNEIARKNYCKILINKKIIDKNKSLDQLLESDKRLRKYKMHLYDVLRLKTNMNSDESFLSKLIPEINSLYNTIQNIEMEYKPTIINGERVVIDNKNYQKYISQTDGKIRRKVFNIYTNNLAKVNRSISKLLNTRMSLCNEIALKKGYSSVIEQIINEDDLDIKIIENLRKSVHSNLHLLNKYLGMKKEDLSLKKIHWYDLSIKNDFNKNITFDEGLDLIKKSLTIMGPMYNESLDKVLESGSLDIYPAKNKFLGGYHFRNYIKSMILMNYKGNLKDVYTTTHELGHAVNCFLVKNNQTYQDFHYSIFLSEIASKVNENIFDNYLFDNANSIDEKKFLLTQRIELYIASVFIQTIYLEFDLKLYDLIHDKKVLTNDIINETFFNIIKEFYSEIEIDENIKYLWQMRLHLFYDQYRIYNFQYATGHIIALKIANDIKNNKDDMLNKYLKFLTIGGSLPTLDTLKITGIDLTDYKTFEESMQYLNSLLNEYEKLLNSEKK